MKELHGCSIGNGSLNQHLGFILMPIQSRSAPLHGRSIVIGNRSMYHLTFRTHPHPHPHAKVVGYMHNTWTRAERKGGRSPFLVSARHIEG
ncbi:hypothetical protein B0H34DRAFT_706652 [Crassisporium funariophilum]|nr:hypothetical protein B0H34DRAFT_706652 [Crassisporium funariophilum]